MWNMIELRGHHLICRLGFRGLGYNDAFVRKMTEVVLQLQSNPELQLKAIDFPDVLCNHCPNLINGECSSSGSDISEKKVQEMDRAVIQILDLKREEIYTVDKINKKLKERFNKEAFDYVCGDCQWRSLGYCEEGFNKL